jgi:hypothetical protein
MNLMTKDDFPVGYCELGGRWRGTEKKGKGVTGEMGGLTD